MKTWIILLSLVLTTVGYAQEKALESEKALKFGMVLSFGTKPGDQDLMLVRRQGRLFSFKYCRANTPNPVPEVIQVHKDYFVNPSKYNDVNKQQALQDLFNSPVCRIMGHDSYGLTEKFYGDRSVFGWSLASGATGIFSLFTIPMLSEDISTARAAQNTDTALGFFFSRKFPHSYLVLPTIAASTAARAYYNYRHNDLIESVGHGTRITYEGIEPVVVAPSMSDFMSRFTKGFTLLLEDQTFVAF
jgi:hypothetical protein